MIVTMTYVFNLYLFLIMIVLEIKNKQTNNKNLPTFQANPMVQDYKSPISCISGFEFLTAYECLQIDLKIGSVLQVHQNFPVSRTYAYFFGLGWVNFRNLARLPG